MNENDENEYRLEQMLRANSERRIELLDARIRDLERDLWVHGEVMKRLETDIGILQVALETSEKKVEDLQRAKNLLNVREEQRTGVLVPNGLKSTADIPSTHDGLHYVIIDQGGLAGLEKK